MTYFRDKKSLNLYKKLILKITYFQWSDLDLKDHFSSVIWSWRSLFFSDFILKITYFQWFYFDLEDHEIWWPAHLWVQVAPYWSRGQVRDSSLSCAVWFNNACDWWQLQDDCPQLWVPGFLSLSTHAYSSV